MASGYPHKLDRIHLHKIPLIHHRVELKPPENAKGTCVYAAKLEARAVSGDAFDQEASKSCRNFVRVEKNWNWERQ